MAIGSEVCCSIALSAGELAVACLRLSLGSSESSHTRAYC